MKRKFIGIDFGSQNTRVYSSSSSSIIFNEPTCVALDTNTNRVFETGYLANKIQGKSPYNYRLVFPVINGMISDVDCAVSFLENAIEEVKNEAGLRGFSVVFSAPSDMSKVNHNALVEIGKKLQAKEIYMESQAKMAAIGSGENIFSPQATLVCNIGSGITDIACVSMGEIVSCTTTSIAGDALDDAIRRYLVKEKHLLIGKKSAQMVKMRVGNVSFVNDGMLVEVKGKDTMTSLPSSCIVSSSELKKVLVQMVSMISLKISDVIQDLDPELASDLTQNGLIITGGGASLTGLKEFMQAELSIPVRVIHNPADKVIEGIALFIKNIEEQERINTKRG